MKQRNHRTTAHRLYWKEVWGFRELMYTLTWRDLKVRYKQTLIGVSWGILRPLITTLIFALVFSRITRFQNPSSAPYLLMVFTGMLPWQFFANTLGDLSQSVTGNAHLIGKIYFPRIVIPFASAVTNLADFGISILILFVMMACYQQAPGWHIIFLPFFLFLLIACVLGTGLYVSVLNVRYRDFKFIIPFVVQIVLFVTPVAFSSGNIPERWRLLYACNPLVGIISGMRWCLLNDPLYWPEVWISCTVVVFLLYAGTRYFRKTEPTFADNL